MVDGSIRRSWYLGSLTKRPASLAAAFLATAVVACTLYGAVPVSAQEAVKAAPYLLRCYQAGVLVVAEHLRGWPRKDQGVWKGERWSADPTELGLAVWVEPGDTAACIVTEGPKRK
jgi:hypothetical protein